MQEKLKSLLADEAIYTVMLLLLVGTVSFGLGRKSVTSEVTADENKDRAGVVLTNTNPQPQNLISQPPSDNPPDTATEDGAELLQVQVAASRGGTKYHLLDCPGAKQMKDTNKIYFGSPAEAQAAGYTAAANCPGLK